MRRTMKQQNLKKKKKVGKLRLAEAAERQRGKANSWLGQILLFQTSPHPQCVNKLAVCLIYGVRRWPDGHYCDWKKQEWEWSSSVKRVHAAAFHRSSRLCLALFVSLASPNSFLIQRLTVELRATTRTHCKSSTVNTEKPFGSGRCVFVSPRCRLWRVINHYTLQCWEVIYGFNS